MITTNKITNSALKLTEASGKNSDLNKEGRSDGNRDQKSESQTAIMRSLSHQTLSI